MFHVQCSFHGIAQHAFLFRIRGAFQQRRLRGDPQPGGQGLGVPMGEPEFRLRPLLRRHNAAVFSSNYALYGDLSDRGMITLRNVVEQLEHSNQWLEKLGSAKHNIQHGGKRGKAIARNEMRLDMGMFSHT